MSFFDRYGVRFTETESLPWSDAEVERYMIQQGGHWTDGKGRPCGDGLEAHFKRYWALLWPEDAQTWWTDLILHEVLKNQFTSLVGPASSWKTGTVARIALMDWSCFPDCTTILMSSTDMEGLRARIYGETAKLWSSAHETFDWWPGEALDYKCVIANEKIDPEHARDTRNGIIGVPCRTSTGRFQGIGKFQGRKNRRVWCIADETQFCEATFLDAQNNLVSNGPNLVAGIIREPGHEEFGKPMRGYKCVFILNPNPTRPDNPGHQVSEPEGGWNSINEDNKTKVWDCKKLPNNPIKCRCVNLNGLDSPNGAYPIEKPRWPHLAGLHKIALYTEGSESYYSQGVGAFKFGLAAFKIITTEVCKQFHAFDSLVWSGEKPNIKIGMCDAAYSGVGGDRCPVGWLEFGNCVDGKQRLLIHPHELCPVVIQKDLSAEDQIAAFTRKMMEGAGVPPENFFFDGRGSLAMAFARLWSPLCNAVEFGGRPTDRPVGADIYTFDMGQTQRRPKLASEHYSKFVSELWWSWRYAIESDQIRGLTMDVVLDACPREWQKVKGDKIEIETKKEMKKRTGCSPDLADCVCVGIEGARRRGFSIAKLAALNTQRTNTDWLERLARQQRQFQEARTLSFR